MIRPYDYAPVFKAQHAHSEHRKDMAALAVKIAIIALAAGFVLSEVVR